MHSHEHEHTQTCRQTEGDGILNQCCAFSVELQQNSNATQMVFYFNCSSEPCCRVLSLLRCVRQSERLLDIGELSGITA